MQPLSSVAKLPRGAFRIRCVAFHGNRKVGDNVVATLGELCSAIDLASVSLHGTSVTDAGLAHLCGMSIGQVLLDETSVSDAGIEHIRQLRGLREVRFNHTKVTAAGVASLRAALPKCKIVWEPSTDPLEAPLPGLIPQPARLPAWAAGRWIPWLLTESCIPATPPSHGALAGSSSPSEQ